MVDVSAAEFMSVPKPQETASQPRPSLQRELLLCGVHAVNSVLEVLGRPKLSKEQVDNINENLAYEERQVLDEGVAPDNAVQPAGNYPIEVLTLALRVYGDCETERIRQPPIPSGLYLVGNGYHWAMAASGPTAGGRSTTRGASSQWLTNTASSATVFSEGRCFVSCPHLNGPRSRPSCRPVPL